MPGDIQQRLGRIRDVRQPAVDPRLPIVIHWDQGGAVRQPELRHDTIEIRQISRRFKFARLTGGIHTRVARNLFDKVNSISQTSQAQHIAQTHPSLTSLIKLVRYRPAHYYQ